MGTRRYLGHFEHLGLLGHPETPLAVGVPWAFWTSLLSDTWIVGADCASACFIYGAIAFTLTVTIQTDIKVNRAVPYRARHSYSVRVNVVLASSTTATVW